MVHITKLLKLIGLGFIIISLASCDFVKSGRGIVVEKNSQRPIDSVLIEAYLINKNVSYFIEQLYTDSTGLFNITSGPLGNGDIDLILVMSKPGYNNIVVKEPKDEKVPLEKSSNNREYFELIYKR